MSDQHPRAIMAKAFRETALSIIGLYQIYEAEPDLCAATAEAIGSVFRRQLQQTPANDNKDAQSPLHELMDELKRMGRCA